LGWTIRTWRRVHWSDQSRFLLRPIDDRARVWHQRNTYWTAVAAPVWIWAGPLSASFCEVYLHVDGQ
jgi:hypothetical protein